MTMMMDEFGVIDINQCLCLPKAELNTKNSSRWQLYCYLVEFLVFNSITHAEKVKRRSYSFVVVKVVLRTFSKFLWVVQKVVGFSFSLKEMTVRYS